MQPKSLLFEPQYRFKYFLLLCSLLVFLLLTFILKPSMADTMIDVNFVNLCASGRPEQIRQALASGSNPNAITNQTRISKRWPFIYSGDSALLVASKYNNLEVIEILLEAGAKPNVGDGRESTALSMAARRQDGLQAVNLLAKYGADVKNDKMALLEAAANPDPALLDFFITSGTDIKAINNAGETALHYAMKNSLPHNARLLLQKGISARQAAADGTTALHLLKLPELVADLKKAGADLNAKNQKGETPLMLPGKSIEVYQAFLEAGADPNCQSNSGSTLLMDFARTRDESMIKMLLQYGADPKITDNEGRSALYTAIQNNKKNALPVAKLLLAAGAKPCAPDHQGNTPLFYAAQWAEEPELIQVFLDAGCPAQPKNIKGQTALMKLCYNKKLNKVAAAFKIMLKAGEELNTIDNEGRSALIHCMLAGLDEIPPMFNLLLDAGANPNIQDAWGATALMYTGIYSSATEVDLNLIGKVDPKQIKNLLAAGADINLRDNEGKTALMYIAENSRQAKSMQLLLTAGSDPLAKDNAGKSVADYIETSKYKETIPQKLELLEKAISKARKKSS